MGEVFLRPLKRLGKPRDDFVYLDRLGLLRPWQIEWSGNAFVVDWRVGQWRCQLFRSPLDKLQWHTNRTWSQSWCGFQLKASVQLDLPIENDG